MLYLSLLIGHLRQQTILPWEFPAMQMKMVPLTYEERDEGSKKPATNLAADANYDGEINRLDAEQAKLIIQGRRSLRLEPLPSTSKGGDRP